MSIIRCLKRDPRGRANAKELIEFVRKGKDVDINVSKKFLNVLNTKTIISFL